MKPASRHHQPFDLYRQLSARDRKIRDMFGEYGIDFLATERSLNAAVPVPVILAEEGFAGLPRRLRTRSPARPADLSVHAPVLPMKAMVLTAVRMWCADHQQDVGPDRKDPIGCDRRMHSGFRGAQVRSDGRLPMMRKPGERRGQCDPAASAGGCAQCRGAAARRRAVTRSRWMM